MSDSNYSFIENLIYNSYKNACIMYIKEIIYFDDHPVLSNYNKLKHNNENETFPLFHGTTDNCINGIVENGFKSDLNIRSAFGKGTYVSPNLNVSLNGYTNVSQQKGFKLSFVFVNSVLTNFIKKGSNSIYVVNCDSAILPKYIVSFHKNPK